MAGKYFMAKDFIGEAIWWERKINYFHHLWEELFLCWLYTRVYPDHGTAEVSFPPLVGEIIAATNYEELHRPKTIRKASQKIIPWGKADIKNALDQLKNTKEIISYQNNVGFIAKEIFETLKDNPEYIVDLKFVNDLHRSIYDGYPFGFDVKRKESFLTLSSVSLDMSILYGILSRIKIKDIAATDIDRCKDMIMYAEICLSHELIESANLLLGYWMGKKPYKPNCGAEKMKRRGENSINIITDIIEEMGIKSLAVFRGNVELRKDFFKKAKETGCDSEDRIAKIARSVLKVKASA